MDSSEAMDRSQCLRLLAQHSVGRVVFTERALPAIRLVDYALIGAHVVLRTGADGLGRRLDGQVVAFEVDQIDQGHAAAWSVVLTGTARLLRHPAELWGKDELPLLTWADPGDSACVSITSDKITGRRIPSAYDAHVA